MRMPRLLKFLPFFALAALGSAQAQPIAGFSGISVDVARLRALGNGPYADLVQGAMTQELQRNFPIDPRGPRLVVRVTGLFLTSSPSTGQGFRGAATDSVDGEAMIVGPKGEVLAAYPQHAALAARSVWYDPQDEVRRTEDVSRYYAQWLRQTIK